jgi:D-3-phosphoglycerate dehydrogenase / 2-oxoglutarate reductase
VVYNGIAKDMNLKALNCAAIAGVMKATNPM